MVCFIPVKDHESNGFLSHKRFLQSKAKADLPMHGISFQSFVTESRCHCLRGTLLCSSLGCRAEGFSTRNLTEILLKPSNRSFQALWVKALWNGSISLWNSRQRNCPGLGHKCDVSRKVTQMVWTSKRKKPQTIHKLFRKYTFFLSPCPSWRVQILFYTHKTRCLTCGGLWWLSLSNSFLTVIPESNKKTFTQGTFLWNLPSGETRLWLTSQAVGWGGSQEHPRCQPEVTRNQGHKNTRNTFLSWKLN